MDEVHDLLADALPLKVRGDRQSSEFHRRVGLELNGVVEAQFTLLRGGERQSVVGQCEVADHAAGHITVEDHGGEAKAITVEVRRVDKKLIEVRLAAVKTCQGFRSYFDYRQEAVAILCQGHQATMRYC